MINLIRYWKIVLLGAILILILSYCSNEVNTPQDTTPPPNYYPSSPGTNYTYDVIQVDSAGGVQNGSRFSIYTGDTLVNDINYTVQLEDFILDTAATMQTSFFRKTSSGVFYFADTTGFSEVVPDSLAEFLSTPLESQAVLFPLAPGSFWTVYRLTVSNQQISFDPLRVNGVFAGIETLTLQLLSGQTDVEATKVKYTFTLQEQPQQLPRELNAYAWFAADIGIVKLEGNAVLINLLAGGVDLSDTTTIITQNLIDFEIK